MAMLKKIGKNSYKIYRQTHSTSNHHGTGNNKTYRDWWSIRAREEGNTGVINIGTINTPENMLGKKIEIFLRIKDDRTKKDNIRYDKPKRKHNRIRTQ
jgi:hypothetical protein